MRDSFSNAIESSIRSGGSLDSLVSIARDFKKAGLTQAEAYSSLEILRQTVGPDEIDLLLDLMDIVSGFCVEAHRIWDGAVSD